MAKVIVVVRGQSVKRVLGNAASCCTGAYRRVFAQLASRKWITAFSEPGPIWERVAFVHLDGRFAPLVLPFRSLPADEPRRLWFQSSAIDLALRYPVGTTLGAIELARAGLAIVALDDDRVLLGVTDVRAARVINEARVRGQIGPCPVRALAAAFLARGDPAKRWIRVSSEMRVEAGIAMEAWGLDCPDILSSKKRVRVRSTRRLPPPTIPPHDIAPKALTSVSRAVTELTARSQADASDADLGWQEF